MTTPIGFRGKQAGEYLQIDFTMWFSGDKNPDITHVTLNGQNVCSEEEPSSPPGNIRTYNKLSFCSGSYD